MKRALAITLIFTLLFAFAGCGGCSKKNTTEALQTEKPTEPVVTTEPPPPLDPTLLSSQGSEPLIISPIVASPTPEQIFNRVMKNIVELNAFLDDAHKLTKYALCDLFGDETKELLVCSDMEMYALRFGTALSPFYVTVFEVPNKELMDMCENKTYMWYTTENGINIHEQRELISLSAPQSGIKYETLWRSNIIPDASGSETFYFIRRDPETFSSVNEEEFVEYVKSVTAPKIVWKEITKDSADEAFPCSVELEPIRADFSDYSSIAELVREISKIYSSGTVGGLGRARSMLFSIPDQKSYETLNMLFEALESQCETLGTLFEEGREFTYFQKDINFDALNELFLCAATSTDGKEGQEIFAIFTTENGKPVLLLTVDYFSACYINEKGLICTVIPMSAPAGSSFTTVMKLPPNSSKFEELFTLGSFGSLLEKSFFYAEGGSRREISFEEYQKILKENQFNTDFKTCVSTIKAVLRKIS